MKKNTILSSLVVLGWAVIPQQMASAGQIEKQTERAFDVQAGGKLLLKSDMGSIQVTSDGGKKVEVRAILKARTSEQSTADKWFEAFDLTFDHKGNQVSVIGEKNRDFNWRNVKLNIGYEINVPQEFHLKLRTGGGSISVENIDGEVDVHTSGGGISLGEINGVVSAFTSGGSVKLEGGSGSVSLQTSGGSITVGKVNGSVDVQTSGGHIHLGGVSGNLKARTSGGSITATLQSQIDQPAELRTCGGGITLSVKETLRADIDARTSGGRVNCDLPVEVKERTKKSHLQGRLNGGGPLVTLETSGGSINIRKL